MAYAGKHQYNARPDYSIEFTAADDAAAVDALDHGDLDDDLRDAVFHGAVAITHVSACPCGNGSDDEFVN